MSAQQQAVAGGTALRLPAAVPALGAGAVGAVLLAQTTAEAQYNAVTSPLSSLYHTTHGWLFPLALVMVALAAIGTARQLAVLGAPGRLPAALMLCAATGSVTAALFPADFRVGGLSSVGEVHRWASLALLLLPMIAALAVTVRSRGVPGRRSLLTLLMLCAAAGLVFLGGFLPALGIHSGLGSALAEFNGMAQRVLGVLVVAVIWQVCAVAKAAAARRATPPAGTDDDPRVLELVETARV